MIGITSTADASAPYGVRRPAGVAPVSSAGRPENLLTVLTADDRALLFEATGAQLTSEGVREDGRAFAPMIASQVAMDRTSGVLPSGQPVTATYLRDLLSRQPAADGDRSGTSAHITAMLDVLARRGGAQRLDLRA
ncbi:hypothetical protein [Modestobacter sp. SYSU DS0875]